MTPRVTLVAADAGGNSAVGSRIGAFTRGLDQRGWDVTIIDLAVPSVTMADRMLSHMPTALCSMLESALSSRVPLVVDYRDPWSARQHPPLLARMTRTIERCALRQAAAVVFAGGPVLGDLLVQHLRLAPDNVISIPNGFEPADTANLRAVPVRSERSGTPLDLVMSGYWYGRNGPGILLDALTRIGPAVAELTVVGGISPPIAAHLHRATGHPPAPRTVRSRRALYERLHQADAAVVTMDTTSAAVLLRRAMRDRAELRPGMLGEGPTREYGVTTLHTLLLRLARQL